MTKQNNTLTWRVEQLERSVSNFDNKLDLLMENHIPHLKLELEALKTRINVMTAVNVSAVILGILIAKYL